MHILVANGPIDVFYFCLLTTIPAVNRYFQLGSVLEGLERPARHQETRMRSNNPSPFKPVTSLVAMASHSVRMCMAAKLNCSDLVQRQVLKL